MNIAANSDRILVFDTEYKDYSLYGSIPGGRWDKKKRAWKYPVSPYVMGRLARGAKDRGIRVRANDKARELFREMERILAFSETNFEAYAWISNTDPWDHQAKAAQFLRAHHNAYLAMEMGTGKTLVTINEMLCGDPIRALVICPKSVIDVWVDEIEKHWTGDPCNIAVLRSGSNASKASTAKQALELSDKYPSVIIVNYESAWRGELGRLLLRHTYDMVVYDEAHKIKSPGGRASNYCAKMAARSKRRILLSGTPIPNNPLDLYGQYRALDSGIFGTNFSRFRTHYAIMGGFQDHEVVAWQNEEELNATLKLSMFSVAKEEVMDLPPITRVRRYIYLPPKVSSSYFDMEEDFVMDVVGGRVKAGNALTRLLRLQQITSGHIHDEAGEVIDLHEEKRFALRDFVEGISQSEAVVVFCRFTRDVRMVEETALELKREYLEVSGRCNGLERGQLPQGFCGLLGVQIASGGLGVNLNAARYAVFFSLGFSLAEYQQAEARLHRGGQKNPVLITHIVAKGTVDERVYSAIEKKEKIVDAILDEIRGRKNV